MDFRLQLKPGGGFYPGVYVRGWTTGEKFPRPRPKKGGTHQSRTVLIFGGRTTLGKKDEFSAGNLVKHRKAQGDGEQPAGNSGHYNFGFSSAERNRWGLGQAGRDGESEDATGKKEKRWAGEEAMGPRKGFWDSPQRAMGRMSGKGGLRVGAGKRGWSSGGGQVLQCLLRRWALGTFVLSDLGPGAIYEKGLCCLFIVLLCGGGGPGVRIAGGGRTWRGLPNAPLRGLQKRGGNGVVIWPRSGWIGLNWLIGGLSSKELGHF